MTENTGDALKASVSSAFAEYERREVVCTEAAVSQWNRSMKRPDMQEKDRVIGAIEAYKRQAFAFHMWDKRQAFALRALESSATASAEREPQCCMCGKQGLSTTEGDGGTECELSDGRWVCSAECWDRAVGGVAQIHPGRLSALEAENARLREALQFYADAWCFTTNPKRGGLEWKPKEALLDDCGNVARAALSTKGETMIDAALAA